MEHQSHNPQLNQAININLWLFLSGATLTENTKQHLLSNLNPESRTRQRCAMVVVSQITYDSGIAFVKLHSYF